MTEDGRGQPTVVTLAGCRCPGGPHPTGDTVTLRAEPSVPMGTAAWAVFSIGGTLWDLQARFAEVWMRYGIIDWSFPDAQGKPEPITPSNIERLLPFNHGGLEVSEAADALYSDAVLSPLVERRSTLSPPTPTGNTPTDGSSTSPSLPSGEPSPTRSKRSRRPASAGSPSEVPAP